MMIKLFIIVLNAVLKTKNQAKCRKKELMIKYLKYIKIKNKKKTVV